MGGGSSQMESSIQDTKNSLLQSSSAECTNNFSNTINNASISIDHSVVTGNTSIELSNIIFGSTCILKNTLLSAITNSQSSNQSADDSDDLAELAQMLGVNNRQDESSEQSIVNDITQILSSICQNKNKTAENNPKITYSYDLIVGDTTISSDQKNENIKCIIDNLARSQLQNTQSSTQVEKMETTLSGIISALIALACVVLILTVAYKTMKNTKSKTTTKPDTSINPVYDGSGYKNVDGYGGGDGYEGGGYEGGGYEGGGYGGGG